MSAPSGPEECIDALRRRLTLHTLLQSAMMFLAPLFAAWYVLFFLYRFAWLGPDATMTAGAALLVFAAALTAGRFRRRAPSPLLAARLIDQKSAAEERFITLATLGPATATADFLSRLKLEAATFARRINIKRDFPFRIDQSIVSSVIAALIAIILFQVGFELTPASRSVAPSEKLADAGKKLGNDPRFADLAAALRAAATKLDQPSLSEKEKQTIVTDIAEKLDRRIAFEKSQGRGVSLLQEIADDVAQAAEKKDDASMTLPFKIPSLFPIPLPWMKQPGDESGDGKGNSGEGEGTGAQKLEQKSSGGSATGEREGEKKSGVKMKEGQRSEGSEALQRKQESPDNRPDAQTKKGHELKNEGEREGQQTSQEKKGGPEKGEKNHARDGDESKDKRGGGGAKSDEKTPERFGEKVSGDLKEKDLRFVIVQLPDEGGSASGSREAQGKRTAGALPSANVPLAPPDERPAARDKQMLPLEYRGMIR
ncbi:MAG TPA: hypothetical protein VL754_00575 [Verrucomicrobiae bacterium]|jgi:hypothetical protein|nr:hypothetical protein [Verrucomicrobiae bacterium]